jgi:hypothetical protein
VHITVEDDTKKKETKHTQPAQTQTYVQTDREQLAQRRETGVTKTKPGGTIQLALN